MIARSIEIWNYCIQRQLVWAEPFGLKCFVGAVIAQIAAVDRHKRLDLPNLCGDGIVNLHTSPEIGREGKSKTGASRYGSGKREIAGFALPNYNSVMVTNTCLSPPSLIRCTYVTGSAFVAAVLDVSALAP